MILNENLTLIERMLSTFNDHDIERMVEFFDENVIDYLPSQKDPIQGRVVIQKYN